MSEQVDSLRVLATDPVDYLVTPRVLASMIAGPILNVLCLCMGIGAAVLLADLVYDVPANVILDSARRALTGYDVATSCVKAWVFGMCISVVSRFSFVFFVFCFGGGDGGVACARSQRPRTRPFPLNCSPPHKQQTTNTKNNNKNKISCAWGFTTSGGAKGVGESTTSAVVISLVTIFVADFVLSFLFFQGEGTALKQLK